MAERRMFAKTIIDSDAFIDMPISARLLYYDLSMRADDDGFVNAPKKIMKFVGASIDDLNILIGRKFVIAFDNGIVVIKHWRIHNYIQKDRYIETKYKEEKSLLNLDENNAYTFNEGKPLITEGTKKLLTQAQQKRVDAKKDSSLPYSFEYKIRNAFVSERCPICNCIMDHSNNLTKPTIQHNIPISMGGKHEIDNISVICNSCNSSIQNHNITPDLNSDLVKEKWYEIENGVGMDTQVRLGKVSIGKDSISKSNNSKFSKPSLEELTTYIQEKDLNVDANAFMDYYDSNGWKIGGKAPMKDWKATCRRWSRTNVVKNMPQWIDKEIEKESIDDKEQKELEDMMKEFE